MNINGITHRTEMLNLLTYMKTAGRSADYALGIVAAKYGERVKEDHRPLFESLVKLVYTRTVFAEELEDNFYKLGQDFAYELFEQQA